MSVRAQDMGEAAWEALVSLLSWAVAIVVLVCLGFFAVADAVKRRHADRATRKVSVGEAVASASLQMEIA